MQASRGKAHTKIFPSREKFAVSFPPVWASGDGLVVDFGEEARRGLSSASGYPSDALAGKAYFPALTVRWRAL